MTTLLTDKAWETLSLSLDKNPLSRPQRNRHDFNFYQSNVSYEGPVQI